MKLDLHKLTASAAFLAMLATSRIAAQTESTECHHTGHRYKLIDL
jgi:hypothetical protein